MATLKYRLNRKNASGTYDTIHYETSSNIVMRPSGRSVEQDLTDFLPRSQNDDNVPQSLTKGKLTCCNSRVFAQTNSITELARMSDVTTEASTRASADTNLQNQVNSLKSSVSNGKTLVANAITGKGVATSPSDTFATMANNIGKIQGAPSGYMLQKFEPFYRYEPHYEIDLAQKNIPYWAYRGTAGTNVTSHCFLGPGGTWGSYVYPTNSYVANSPEPYQITGVNHAKISDTGPNNYRIDRWDGDFYPSAGKFIVDYTISGYTGNGGGSWFEFVYLKQVS